LRTASWRGHNHNQSSAETSARKAAAVVVLNSDLHFQYCGAVAARLEKLPILCRKSGGIAEGLRIKKLLTPLSMYLSRFQSG